MAAHQVLSSRQFSGVADLPEEKSIDSPDPQNIIPEKEDEDIGQAPN
jgi:hypothetical protein